MIRVLIADDQPGVRRGIAVILSQAPEIEVIGEASSGPEAVALAEELLPDVVLMDVRMPGGDGINATRALTRRDREKPMAVVVMTMVDLDEYLYSALEAGAAGFLVKNLDALELSAAIHAAARGDAMISPSLTRRVLVAAAEGRAHPAAQTVQTAQTLQPDKLKPREVRLLRALSRGLSNNEIAHELHFTSNTVRIYLSDLIAKTGTRNRTHLAVWAYRNGFGE